GAGAARKASAVIAPAQAVGTHHSAAWAHDISGSGRDWRGYSESGTLRSNSSSQTAACASDGARQSPRGDKEPPEEIFGPFGNAERLNWLCSKNRTRKTRSHFLISARP